MKAKHPSDFFSELSEDRLATIAELLLDVRFNTTREMTSSYDDTYTRECAIFGRSKNALIELCKKEEHDWLELASPGMDVTFRIGNVPCRFFRDDPESPVKRGFFRRNQVDDLFADDDDIPVMWRFVVERAMTEEDEDRAFFIGLNIYQEKVCQWSYSPTGPILHSVDTEVPPTAELPPAKVGVRGESDQREEKTDDHDSPRLNETQRK
ncbi:hypothetical protein [Halomonas sp. MCCC 1A11062]|uniref:hypothetical protein n=1 Tax=Halomonas sp. MCCC 1A11062 TaxID=2733485 RepID=UPI001F162ED2|nr:hypothetical protein [Halomonas sp. MCCC 1A11062]MCE8040223.1 hypothetical protein [Halomonas sp. MCCC 1A11062]